MIVLNTTLCEVLFHALRLFIEYLKDSKALWDDTAKSNMEMLELPFQVYIQSYSL